MALDYYGSSSVNDKILNTQYVKLLVFSSVYGKLYRYIKQTRLAEGMHFMCEKIIKRNIPITAMSWI